MEELTYQNVHPDNIQAAAQRVRQLFKGPTRDEAEKLKKKCLAVQSGELTGKRAVFSAHEQILLPYLLPWACQKPERLDFFMESVQDEAGHSKSRVEEFWGDSWQKAVKAFFEYFQDTESFRILGRTLYMAKDKEAMADKQPVNRPYLKLLTDSRGTRLCQAIISDGLGKAAQDWGLLGPNMLGSLFFFRSGYVNTAMHSYMSSRVLDREKKKLLGKCIEFLQNRSREQRGWLRKLYDTWCMSKVDMDKPKNSWRELKKIEAFKDEVFKNAKLKAYIKDELNPYPKTKRAIEKLRTAKEKAVVEVPDVGIIQTEWEQRPQEYQAMTKDKMEDKGLYGQKSVKDNYSRDRTIETSGSNSAFGPQLIGMIESPAEGTERGETKEPAEKPGLLKKAWQKIKSWFSFGQK